MKRPAGTEQSKNKTRTRRLKKEIKNRKEAKVKIEKSK